MVTTDSAHQLPVAPNPLDRRFDGWKPDQAWVADITYVPTGEGWLYLAAVMDLAGRRVHSDHGAQYASGRYRALAAELGSRCP